MGHGNCLKQPLRARGCEYPGKELYVLLDNLNTHKPKERHGAVSVPPGVVRESSRRLHASGTGRRMNLMVL